jgi:hypothetical protein
MTMQNSDFIAHFRRGAGNGEFIAETTVFSKTKLVFERPR